MPPLRASSAFPGAGRARLLLPEGGDRPARPALRARAERSRLRDRHAPPLPGDLRALARGRAALRHEGRGVRGAQPAELADGHGEQLWERKPDLYLAIAKVEPLTARSAASTAWITGVRRDQSPTRADAPKLGWDAAHELWKANPLADWSDDDCWAYIKRARAPVQRAARPGLRLDRRHALDLPGRAAARAAGRAASARSAACTRPGPHREPAHALASRRPRGRGDPHHARGRRRA